LFFQPGRQVLAVVVDCGVQRMEK